MNSCCIRRPASNPAGFATFALWLLVSVLAWPSIASGEEAASKTLRIAYVEFPPLSYRNEAGEADGAMMEITRKVAIEAGYTPEFIYLPVSRVYLYLRNGLIDLWPGPTDIPTLDGEVLESWASPMPIQLSAWYSQNKMRPLENFNQLRGKTVIVIGGYTYAGLINWLNDVEDIRITEAPNHRSAIDMLKRNRGDYLLDYREPVLEILDGPADEKIGETEVRSRNVAWLFSLARPRAAILREEFDDAYLRLAEKGEVPGVRTVMPAYIIPGFPEQYR
ncbi:transporter substrate-binding domain-containing protein [Marinobacter sp. M216]|uniref:Transporter substrate-binding domain-containing protein n=1 Tax=Marinobacter albus TaxID=3030833 RepID=A0ABT7HD30_9GAMM|nr:MULTISPECIES: transporter substrate-binding domain-containing protein [unclassified Marinobacter]MBW7471716.1 transporter substrate-binding domain-containing protein [Marinobacter sp. F4218]MDK9558285.1 transporter substrate-binding domain-containing protein [Marinobacter sp. M216]